MDKDTKIIGIMTIAFLIAIVVFYDVAITVSNIKPKYGGLFWFPFISSLLIFILIWIPHLIIFFRNKNKNVSD